MRKTSKLLIFVIGIALIMQFPVTVKSEEESDMSGTSAASDTSDYKFLAVSADRPIRLQ